MKITMTRLAAPAIVSAGLLAATSATGAVAAAPPAWHQYAVPVTGEATLTGVVAPGRDDAWAAGFTIAASAGTSAVKSLISPSVRAVPRAEGNDDSCVTRGFLDSLMLHWNGRAWQRVTVPDLGRINEMSAADATHIWAVADCGLLYWNGTSWTSVEFPAPGEVQGGAGYVAADRPDDAWLAAGTFDPATGTNGAVLEHWNGRTWTPAALPDLGPDYSLNAVAARGPGDVWVAGTDFTGDDENPAAPEHLILLHWNGRSWTLSSEPPTGMWTKRVSSLSIGSAHDVWMAGWAKVAPDSDQLRHPLALHWNGRTWTSTPVPDGSGEIFQTAMSSNRLWAVGDTFSPSLPSYTMDFLRWTGSRWVNAPIPPDADQGSLLSEASIPGGGLWAVGETGAANTPVIALWS